MMRSVEAEPSIHSTLDENELEEATRRIHAGEIVAVPTETYYALAVDARQVVALDRLFERKDRQAKQPVSLLIEPEMLGDWVAAVPAPAAEWIKRYWPGPLTLALPVHPARNIDARLVEARCIAVRVSPHPVARALVQACGTALTATSANPAGLPPASTREAVLAYYPDLFVLGREQTPGGLASTMVRVTENEISILRRGPISI